MEVVSAIVGPIIEKTVGCLRPHIVREIGKVFHGTNIKNLGQKIQELEKLMDNIKRKTDEAERKPGEIVLSKCLEWLKEASHAKADAENFLEEKLKGEGRCLCPNIHSRCLLGNQLIKKTAAIVELLERGNNFQTVSQLAPLPSFGSRFRSSDYEELESRKLVFEEIMKALKDDSRRVIGIWGMGGVGKTTMVKKVGDVAKKELTFGEVVLAVVSQNPDVRNIQGQLADQLHIKLEGETEVGRADSLRTGLLKDGKKILVILDDIWTQLDLKRIGIASEDGIKGSKVLLTSRKQNVCREMQDQNPICIQHLSDEEAWNLFHKKVGSTIKSHDMLDLAQQVCRKCGGLPVAILAVAGALNSKDIRIWQNALNQLNTSNLKEIEGVDRNVCASLMVSYNQLEYEAAKSCFLFCCLLPEDCDIPIELLMRLGRGMGFVGDMKKLKLREARNSVYGLVDKLKDFSLLLEGKDKEHVKMHDVVRDIGISIASQGQFLIETGEKLEEWPEEETSNCYTAISFSFKSIRIQELPDGLKCPKLHTLVLGSRDGFDIPDIFFNEMKKLNVLVLHGRLRSSMPLSIQNLNDLRVLWLEGRKLGDITWIGKLKRLEMLILWSSDVTVLPIEIGDLNRLRLFDLRGCRYLKIISPHVLSRFSQLEELLMPMVSQLWGHGGMKYETSKDLAEMCERATFYYRDKEFNHFAEYGRVGEIYIHKCADLAELIPLSRLESLEICVPNFDMWPDEKPFYTFLANLTSFKISINSLLSDEECGAWKKVLKLVDVPLRCGVDVLLKKADALYMFVVKDLSDCSMDNGEGESFSDLTFLRAYWCEGVQEFMFNVLEREFVLKRQPHLESFSKLRVLKIEVCDFKYLLSPSAAKVLVQLQELERLRKLGGFYPNSEENADFSGQPLFNEKVGFPELEKLIIEKAGEWTELVGYHLLAQESFSKLRELTVRKMNSLSTMGSSTLIPRLQSLQELHLRNCGSLRAVFKAERRMQITDEEGIVATEECFEFPALQILSITDCCLVGEFCWSQSSRSIEEPEETTFFHNTIGFPNLRELTLEKMEKVKEIWMDRPPPPPRSFCNLTRLFIRGCHKLERVIPPAILPRLHHLEWLHVESCDSVREVVGVGSGVIEQQGRGAAAAATASSHAVQIIFPQLEELNLVNLPNLTSLCPVGYLLFQRESSLKNKRIERRPKLQAFAPKSSAIGDEPVEASAESSIQYKHSESFPTLQASAPQNDGTSGDETDNLQASAPQKC